LFVKHSILQFFFQMPALPADLSLWRGVDLETTDRPIQRAPEQNNGLDQARERIRALQNSAAQTAAQNAAQNAVHEAAQAAITLRLEDAEKRLAAQQEENVHNKTRLSEARESSAGQLAQIQHYQKRIDELETVERNRMREESRQQLELAEKLCQSQQTIETLERTIADHESAREIQVVLAKQH
jgi:TolA-binding protein